MYNFKFLSKNTHSTAQKISKEIKAHPNRPYAINCSEYNFPESTIKELLRDGCNVCIHESDFTKTKIEGFISGGKSQVILFPKGFKEIDLKSHLRKGASSIFSINDGFDPFQIKLMIQEAKEKPTILPEKAKGNATNSIANFEEQDLENYINEGAKVLIKKEDGFFGAAILRLANIKGDLLNIHSHGYSDRWLRKFLNNKAIVTIGEGNNLPRTTIEGYVQKFGNQIHLSSVEFDDETWLTNMEISNAVIV